jgi:transcriptional regulator with XRE-family HTH domain
MWERTGSLPRADLIIPIAQALGVSPEEILGEPKRPPLGQRIARARLQAGLSQSELARKLGVGRTNLAQWERSAPTVKPDPLCALADALAGELDVSVDELLGVPPPPPKPPSPRAVCRGPSTPPPNCPAANSRSSSRSSRPCSRPVEAAAARRARRVTPQSGGGEQGLPAVPRAA